jgi:hypothetical protein
VDGSLPLQKTQRKTEREKKKKSKMPEAQGLLSTSFEEFELKELSNIDLQVLANSYGIKLDYVGGDNTINTDAKYFIINNQHSNQPGTHWCSAIWTNKEPNNKMDQVKLKKDCIFFDPLGFGPDEYIEQIFQEITYNQKRYQNVNMSTCGWWSLCFLAVVQDNEDLPTNEWDLYHYWKNRMTNKELQKYYNDPKYGLNTAKQFHRKINEIQDRKQSFERIKRFVDAQEMNQWNKEYKATMKNTKFKLGDKVRLKLDNKYSEILYEIMGIEHNFEDKSKTYTLINTNKNKLEYETDLIHNVYPSELLKVNAVIKTNVKNDSFESWNDMYGRGVWMNRIKKIGNKIKNHITGSVQKHPNSRPGFPEEKHIWLHTPYGMTRANYAGPGTNVERRIERNDPPINEIDAVAKKHDISYNQNKGNPEAIRKADIDFINELNDLHGINDFDRKAVMLAILGKVALEKLGYSAYKEFSGEA